MKRINSALQTCMLTFFGMIVVIFNFIRIIGAEVKAPIVLCHWIEFVSYLIIFGLLTWETAIRVGEDAVK